MSKDQFSAARKRIYFSGAAGKPREHMGWPVCRSPRHIASPNSAPLTVISPYMKDLFEAASTLINTINNLE